MLHHPALPIRHPAFAVTQKNVTRIRMLCSFFLKKEQSVTIAYLINFTGEFFICHPEKRHCSSCEHITHRSDVLHFVTLRNVRVRICNVRVTHITRMQQRSMYGLNLSTW